MSNNIINPDQTFRDSTGAVRAFGLLTVYDNNTTTKATVYSDTDLSVAQSNPYTLDAYGRVVGDLTWAGLKTIVVTNEDGSDPFTRNDVATTTAALGDWSAAVTATYVSDYVFTLAGDQTADFTVNRRVKLTGGADRYGFIQTSVYTSLTTVTLRNVTDNTPAVAVLNSGNNTAAVSIVSNSLSPLPYGDAWPIYEQIDSTGAATITEDIIIMPGGHLNITAATTLSGSILIQPGGQLTEAGGALTASAKIVNHGTITIGTATTIAADIHNTGLMTVNAAVTFSGENTCSGGGTIAGTGDLTYSESFTAGCYNWYTGSGTLVFPQGQKGYPQWFGAAADDSTDDSTPFQAAVTALGEVLLQGVYRFTAAGVSVPTNTIIRGSNPVEDKISNNTDTYAFTLTNCQFSKMEGFQIYSIGTDGADLGILVEQSGSGNSLHNTFRDLWIHGNTRASYVTTTQVGIYFSGAATGFANYFNTIDNCRFASIHTAILADFNANAGFITNVQFQNVWRCIKGGMQEWQGHNMFWHSTSGSGADSAYFIDLIGASGTNKSQYNDFVFHAEPGTTLTAIYSFDANTQTNSISGKWQATSAGTDSGTNNTINHSIARTQQLSDFSFKWTSPLINDVDSNSADAYTLDFFGDGTTGQAGTGQQRLRIFGGSSQTRHVEISQQVGGNALFSANNAGAAEIRGSGSGVGVILGDGVWNGEPVQIGTGYYLWMNGNDLYISIGAPTTATDGTLIATAT